MLYFIIKLMAIIAVKTFFNKISAENQDYISTDVPIIFAANHPNMMMDPLIIGYTCKRNLHFFAKNTFFDNPLAGWFLKKIQIVPIYRKQDDPAQMNKNERTFVRGYEILKQNKAFLIFPEGISTGERILSEIKTGAARIGCGAEAENDWQLGVQIIPVGLNYTHAIKFRSDVAIRFGQPIHLSDFQHTYQQDKQAAVICVTEQIETALSKLTVNLQDLEMQEIVEALEKIYKQDLAVDLGLAIEDKSADFSVTKGLINAVEWYYAHKPELVEEFKAHLFRYQRFLDRLQIKDEFLHASRSGVTFSEKTRAIFFIIFMFPFYLYGLINNMVPYKFPRWYVRHFVKYKPQVASWKMISGAVVFLIYYPILIIVVAFLSGNIFWTFLYAISLIPSGNFVLKYMHRFRTHRQHLRFLSIFYRKRTLIYNLMQQRTRIITFLNTCKKEYLAAVRLNAQETK